MTAQSNTGFKLAEFNQLKQEILSNQAFISSFVIFGNAASLAFLAALWNSKDPRVAVLGPAFISFLEFVFCRLVIRKLNRTYHIGAYIRFAIEPSTCMNWEAVNAFSAAGDGLFGMSGPRDYVDRGLSRVKSFFTSTASTTIAVFFTVQLYCMSSLWRPSSVGTHTALYLLSEAVILFFIVTEIRAWSRVRLSDGELAALSYQIRKLRRPQVLTAFFRRLRQSPDRLLLLDYDGTLSVLVKNRDEAVTDDNIRRGLRELMRDSQTRVVLISGRPVGEVAQRMEGDGFAVEIWGEHGRVRRSADGNETVYQECRPDGSDINDVVHKLTDLVATRWKKYLKPEDVEVKHETGAVALHWRRLRERVDRAETDKRFGIITQAFLYWQVLQLERQVKKIFAPVVARRNFVAETFRYGLELKCRGRNKGDAVRDVMLEYDPDRVAVAYLGDDATDEDAFRELQASGLTVLVANGIKTSEADIQVSFPNGVTTFLKRWAVVCRAAATTQAALSNVL